MLTGWLAGLWRAFAAGQGRGSCAGQLWKPSCSQARAEKPPGPAWRGGAGQCLVKDDVPGMIMVRQQLRKAEPKAGGASLVNGGKPLIFSPSLSWAASPILLLLSHLTPRAPSPSRDSGNWELPHPSPAPLGKTPQGNSKNPGETEANSSYSPSWVRTSWRCAAAELCAGSEPAEGVQLLSFVLGDTSPHSA